MFDCSPRACLVARTCAFLRLIREPGRQAATITDVAAVGGQRPSWPTTYSPCTLGSIALHLIGGAADAAVDRVDGGHCRREHKQRVAGVLTPGLGVLLAALELIQHDLVAPQGEALYLRARLWPCGGMGCARSGCLGVSPDAFVTVSTAAWAIRLQACVTRQCGQRTLVLREPGHGFLVLGHARVDAVAEVTALCHIGRCRHSVERSSER